MISYHVVVSDLRKVELRSVVVDVGDVNNGVTRRTETGNSISGSEAGRDDCADRDLVHGAAFPIQRLGSGYCTRNRIQPKRRGFSISTPGTTGSKVPVADSSVGKFVERVEVSVDS